MTDEEKKAVEYLKQNDIVEIQYDNYGLESIHRVGIDEKQTILNLIENQSKEIEELKEEQAKRNWVHIKENGEVEPLFYISKDKIKAKIEEWKKEAQIRINVINNKVLDEKTLGKARIELSVIQEIIIDLQSLLEEKE